MQSGMDAVADRCRPNGHEAVPRVPAEALAKIGVGTTLVVAFLRAAYEPGAGLGAIEFWLLLFFSAATNRWADDRHFTSDEHACDAQTL